jgi:ribonuclease PH
MGNTVVLVAATVEEQVPPWLRGKGRGWVTAEYDMLPGSVSDRSPRGKQSGRSQEIQRLIGRALRASIDLEKLGERRITVDCDVLEADGGTRTASITAAYVALREATDCLVASGAIPESPIVTSVAAVSVGILQGDVLLDLCYEEDAGADVDMNVVATGTGDLVEVQGTAEGKTFSLRDNQSMLKLALRGIERLRRAQERCLENPGAGPRRLI